TLRGLRDYSRGAIEKDMILKGAVERYLYLGTQATIDLAEEIIAFKGFRRPGSYSESFYVLEEQGLLSAGLTRRLVSMAGFRNVIAHDYAKLDFKRVYDVLRNDLGDIEEFVSEVKKSLNL
ncbi:MAG: DUF86 domain-containing protein, partial [Chloroflexi bacterium]|nr:DUF86 domain-containing protein [Chloroflexota bacterium]